METLLPGMSASPNAHPMFVHFPVAFWIAAFGFCLWGVVRESEAVWVSGRRLLYLGTVSALGALVTGMLAADAMGHDSPGHGMVHVHRNLMIGTTLLAALACAFAHAAQDPAAGGKRRAVLAALFAVVVVMTLGADRGAEMVYRYGIGTAGETPPSGDGHSHDHGAAPEHAPPHVHPAPHHDDLPVVDPTAAPPHDH